jgi:hypothetical protein
MRRPRNFLTLALLALAVFWAGIFWSGCSLGRMVYDPKGYRPPPPRRSDPDAGVFARYRKWESLNPKPVPVVSVPQGFCSAGSGTNQAGMQSSTARFQQVYVNELGFPGMEAGQPDLPEGSILVKEHLADPKQSSPNTVLAMVKREEGFNPEAGDWEFFVLHNREQVIVDRGRLVHCQSCHVQARERGYVFRHLYVPPGPRKKRWTIF